MFMNVFTYIFPKWHVPVELSYCVMNNFPDLGGLLGADVRKILPHPTQEI